MKVYFNGHTIYPNEETARAKALESLNFRRNSRIENNPDDIVTQIKERISHKKNVTKHTFYFNYQYRNSVYPPETRMKSYSVREVAET